MKIRYFQFKRCFLATFSSYADSSLLLGLFAMSFVSIHYMQNRVGFLALLFYLFEVAFCA